MGESTFRSVRIEALNDSGPTASGRWVTLGQAVKAAAEVTDVPPWRVHQALSMRLGLVIAFSCSHWTVSRTVKSGDGYIREYGEGAGVPDISISVSRSIFTEALDSDNEALRYACWETGDFDCDLADFWEEPYRACFIGVRVDEVALRESFAIPINAFPSGQVAGVLRTDTRLGRPPKWDWEAALAHVAAIANLPDGLGDGPGTQARIERMIADHLTTDGETPSETEVRKRAVKVMSAVNVEGRKRPMPRVVGLSRP